MRVTRYTDYSLRVLIYLGLRPDHRSTIREISEAYDISRNHLMKVVQQLASLGYVRSVRGVGGGLNLAVPAAEIAVGNVVRDMEPDLDLVECMRSDNRCVISQACKLKRMLEHARDSFVDVLNEYTLADLLAPDQARELALALKIDLSKRPVQQSPG